MDLVSPDDYHSLSFWGTDADATGMNKTPGVDEKKRKVGDFHFSDQKFSDRNRSKCIEISDEISVMDFSDGFQ